MPEDLRLSRDRYLVLAFAGADALFELDPELRVRWAAGPAGILGRPPELLLGRSFLELLHPREHGMVELLLRGAGSAGSARRWWPRPGAAAASS